MICDLLQGEDELKEQLAELKEQYTNYPDGVAKFKAPVEQSELDKPRLRAAELDVDITMTIMMGGSRRDALLR